MCTTRVGKKLINSLETCVDDFVNGFIFTHPNLQLMDGHRIVFRRDFEIGETPHVVVIGGGASGHEPAEIGELFFTFSFCLLCALVVVVLFRSFSLRH